MKTFYITGDCHGVFERFKDSSLNKSDIAVIILGDAGINYTLDERDDRVKDYITSIAPNITFYCVRGNHDARPQSVKGMKLIYDPEVRGKVYVQKKWPNIRYFKDFGIYYIPKNYGGFYRIAVVGGAYSVDKWYRLTNNRGVWFADEQLSEKEFDECYKLLADGRYDFVLTHTCPTPFMPQDLFLQGLDSSLVDNSTENFLYKLSNDIKWKIWLFGHFHADRIEFPHVQLFYYNVTDINEIWDFWTKYDKDHSLYWFADINPFFYALNNVGYEEINK